MINKAQIEIPPRFANMPPINPDARAAMFGKNAKSGAEWRGAAGLAADVRYYGEWMRERAYAKIGHLYPTHNGETVIAWIWARTVKSPNPAVDVHVPLVRSFELSKKKGKHIWVEPLVNPLTREVSFVVRSEALGDSGPTPDGIINRNGALCLATGVPISLDYIKAEGKAGRLGVQLIAIVTHGRNGRNYHNPTPAHEAIALSAKPEWVPSFDMSTHSQYMAPPRYGMTTFEDLFTRRQLVGLSTLTDLIPEVNRQVLEDARSASEGNALAYAKAISTYLALNISKLADLGNALCPWEPVAECPRNLFGRQLVSMTWNFAEGNFFSDSSGSWGIIVENFERNIRSYMQLSHLPPSGEIVQRDAKKLTAHEQFILSTDPPYYDNVPYADLADFFYVWLRKSLREFYPDVFTTVLVPKESELVADVERWGGRLQANKFFRMDSRLLLAA